MNRTLNGRRGLAVVVLLVLASLGSALAATIDVGTDGDGTNFTAITTSQTWTADNVYILKEVIYVTNGATLTIEPGTVIRGEPATLDLRPATRARWSSRAAPRSVRWARPPSRSSSPTSTTTTSAATPGPRPTTRVRAWPGRSPAMGRR